MSTVEPGFFLFLFWVNITVFCSGSWHASSFISLCLYGSLNCILIDSLIFIDNLTRHRFGMQLYIGILLSLFLTVLFSSVSCRSSSVLLAKMKETQLTFYYLLRLFDWQHLCAVQPLLMNSFLQNKCRCIGIPFTVPHCPLFLCCMQIIFGSTFQIQL